MTKHRNVTWNLPDQVNYDVAQLAVLMDVRDELQKLNRLLGCSNFTNIPHTLTKIEKRIAKNMPLRKVKK